MRSSIVLVLLWLVASLDPGSVFAQRTNAPRSMAIPPRAPYYQRSALGASGELSPVWVPADGDLQPPTARDPIATPLAATASLPEDAAWEGFVTPALGWTDPIFIEFQGKLVVRTEGIAGSVASSHLATWDGSKFEALPRCDGIPAALGIWNDHLVEAEDYPSFRILMLNGAAWDTLGTANSYVNALREYQGSLIVGGGFASVNGVPTPGVADWNGTNWSSAGTGLSSSNNVTGLAVHVGSLIAVGGIGGFNGVASLNVLGGAWQPVGTGFTGGVYGVASDGVDLYVTGSLGSSGGVTMSGLARWDGAQWNSAGGPVSVGNYPELTPWNGRIVTTFRPGGPAIAALSQWDGVSLSTIPGDSIGVVSQVGTWGTKLVVSGTFQANGSEIAPAGILAYDGAQWSPVVQTWAPGMTGPQNGFISDMRSWGGKLIVVGYFNLLADQDHWVIDHGISAWDGSHWSALGGGVGVVYAALGEYGGDLIAAGYSFSTSTGIRNVARWDGAAWSALGSNAPDYISAVVTFQNDLYVGTAGGFAALSKWNGTTWTDIPGSPNEYVNAIAPAAGMLVVGGTPATIDGSDQSDVMFWDGTNWHAAGLGVNKEVDAAAEWLGQPVIGGRFTASGTTPLPGVAIWDGSAWQPMGTRAVEVYNLRVLDGELFATGEFRLPDDSVAETIAHWTGTDWHVLGSGSDQDAFASYGGYLYQAGVGLVHGHPSVFSRVPLGAVLDVPRPQTSGHGVILSASPNPSRTFTRFSFTLPSAARARVSVVDIAGRVVATLVDGRLDAGEHEVRWTAPAPAGVYLARLDTPAGHRVVRVVRFE